MAGFFDYLLGREEYASDAPLDPTTGLRPADRRQAALQALGNFSAVLSQVGAARNPAEAAMAWSAMPSAVGAGQTYLDELGKQRRVQAQELRLRELMKDPEQLRKLGLNENQLGLINVLPPDTAAAFMVKAASADPLKAQQAKALEELIAQLPPNQQLLARAAPQAFVTQTLAAQKPKDLPEAYRLYQLSQKQNIASGKPVQTFDEWDAVRRTKSAAQNIINMPGSDGTLGTDEFLKEFNKKYAQRFGSIIDEAENAYGMNLALESLKELVNDPLLPEGALTGKLAQMFPSLAGSKAQAFEALVKRLAPTMRVTGSGSTSDREFESMLTSLPKLSNTREGNNLILEALFRKQQIMMKRGEIVNDWFTKKKTMNEAVSELMKLNKQSMLSPELKRQILGNEQQEDPKDFLNQ